LLGPCCRHTSDCNLQPERKAAWLQPQHSPSSQASWPIRSAAQANPAETTSHYELLLPGLRRRSFRLRASTSQALPCSRLLLDLPPVTAGFVRAVSPALPFLSGHHPRSLLLSSSGRWHRTVRPWRSSRRLPRQSFSPVAVTSLSEEPSCELFDIHTPFRSSPTSLVGAAIL